MIIDNIIRNYESYRNSDEYEKYSLSMKILIILCDLCTCIALFLGIVIWGISLSSLINFVSRIGISEIVIPLIAHFGFTLGISYISLWIAGKFVELSDNIRINENIKINIRKILNEKRGTTTIVNNKMNKQDKFNLLTLSLSYIFYMSIGIYILFNRNTGWDYFQQCVITLLVMIYTNIEYGHALKYSGLLNKINKKLFKSGKHFKK